MSLWEYHFASLQLLRGSQAAYLRDIIVFFMKIMNISSLVFRSFVLLIFSGICLFACTTKPNSVAKPENSYRPYFHFTPLSGWMNDPNGLVFYDHEFHLFYQHYPDSTVWGPMHWGHAVSKDLLKWDHLPIALFPDSLGYVFSGSALVDSTNTSGLGSAENPPMLAYFTYHQMEDMEAGKTGYQSQGVAYSLDKGRTWEKYSKNPILTFPEIKDFRDPKVFYHHTSKQWVMVIGSGDHYKFYNSKNLLDWTYASSFGKEIETKGVWECPDLFPLPFAGKDIWVMITSVNDGGPNGGSSTQYFLGDFDGQRFTLNEHYMQGRFPLWLDFGKDNFAGITWSGIPATDGRRIFIGWMSNWQYAQKVPTKDWRGAMTIPRILSLVQTEDGIRIKSEPVNLSKKEGNLNADKRSQVSSLSSTPLVIDFSKKGATVSNRLSLYPINEESNVLLEFSNVLNEKVTLRYHQDSFYFDRHSSGFTKFSPHFAAQIQQAPRFSDSDTLHLNLLLEPASIEIFADSGLTTMTNIFFPSTPFHQLKIKPGTQDSLFVNHAISAFPQ